MFLIHTSPEHAEIVAPGSGLGVPPGYLAVARAAKVAAHPF